MTHTGKIGRLPEELQDELNRHLVAQVPDAQLLPWLNGLPEVEAVLARDFASQKITLRNLKAWKAGGYRQWVAEETAFLDAFERTQARQRAQTLAGELTSGRQINSLANQKTADTGQKSFSFLPAP